MARAQVGWFMVNYEHVSTLLLRAFSPEIVYSPHLTEGVRV